MLQLLLGKPSARKPLQILCLGAHCDDIEIGCGGALLALLKAYPQSGVAWVILSGSPQREREARASARRFLRQAGESRVIVRGHRDGYFPGEYAAIKDEIEALKSLPEPDLVFTHHRADLHQDHRLVGELTWNTFRSHLVLEYEIPKYDGGLITPSAYVALDEAQVERKIAALLGCYRSQRDKHWFDAETFRGLMRLRGIESGSTTGWAEGFHASKLLLG